MDGGGAVAALEGGDGAVQQQRLARPCEWG